MGQSAATPVVKGERASRHLDELIYAAIRRAKEDPSHDGHDVVSHFVRAKDQGIVDWTFANERAIRDEVLVLCGYVDGPIATLVQRLRLEPQGREIPEVSNVGATVLGRTPVAISARS